MDCYLAQFRYVSYNEEDFDKFGAVYNYNGYSAGYYKRNLTANAHPESKDWTASMVALYQANSKLQFYRVNSPFCTAT